MILIEKENYILKTWEPEDAESLAGQLNNRKIWDNCRDALPHPYRVKHAHAFIGSVRQKEGIHDFCIVIDGKAAGNIGFVPQTDVERYNAEVGYVLGEAYWNRGIMTEALKDAIDYYFRHTDTIRLFAYVFEGNPASMRVLEKAGFERIARMRKAVYKNGCFKDLYAYERVSDFPGRAPMEKKER